MQIAGIINLLETIAPPALQEAYDNAGLITGSPQWECSGAILALDATEEVIEEAINKKYNLVVAHHPIVFSGLKKITGKNYVERAIIKAIKNDIAIYAIHTNLDNVMHGVNGKIAALIGLQNCRPLLHKEGTLKKLFTFAPVDKAEQVRNAIFTAGGGQIGNYSECSFNAEGTGTFKAESGADPYVGELGKQHKENEVKIEVIFPAYLEHLIVGEMKKSHPYEEVAYDVVSLSNVHRQIGSGIIGELAKPMTEGEFLRHICTVFRLKMAKHTPLTGSSIQRVAVCGGAGSFLISRALASEADAYITADIKYHEFFDADGKMLLTDIGHYESEQFTIDLLHDLLKEKFPNFAALKTTVDTNPVRYFAG